MGESSVTFQSSVSGPGEFGLRLNSPAPLTDDWKFTDESSITFQSSVSGPGEFGLSQLFIYIFSGPVPSERNMIVIPCPEACRPVEHPDWIYC